MHVKNNKITNHPHINDCTSSFKHHLLTGQQATLTQFGQGVKDIKKALIEVVQQVYCKNNINLILSIYQIPTC